jgi:hypothetical protein
MPPELSSSDRVCRLSIAQPVNRYQVSMLNAHVESCSLIGSLIKVCDRTGFMLKNSGFLILPLLHTTNHRTNLTAIAKWIGSSTPIKITNAETNPTQLLYRIVS